MNPDDPTTPDMARCDVCGAWKPRDEARDVVDIAGGTWRLCDDCQAVPF